MFHHLGLDRTESPDLAWSITRRAEHCLPVCVTHRMTHMRDTDPLPACSSAGWSYELFPWADNQATKSTLSSATATTKHSLTELWSPVGSPLNQPSLSFSSSLCQGHEEESLQTRNHQPLAQPLLRCLSFSLPPPSRTELRCPSRSRHPLLVLQPTACGAPLPRSL